MENSLRRDLFHETNIMMIPRILGFSKCVRFSPEISHNVLKFRKV